MFENLTKKQKIIFGIIIIFMVSVIIYYIYSTLNEYDYDISSNNIDDNYLFDNTSVEDNTNESTEDTEILIHVSGSVKNDTVVTLPEGSRINDAIEAAGGLTKDADLTNINLAYILEDGEKIYIPKKGEEIVEDVSNTQSTSANTSSSSSNKTSKININKATQTELETIPGVGPSTALKIIDYRDENGKFSSIEDIRNVSGIGDAKYEKMKDYIAVK